jgi:hypothetical protein
MGKKSQERNGSIEAAKANKFRRTLKYKLAITTGFAPHITIKMTSTTPNRHLPEYI